MTELDFLQDLVVVFAAALVVVVVLGRLRIPCKAVATAGCMVNLGCTREAQEKQGCCVGKREKPGFLSSCKVWPPASDRAWRGGRRRVRKNPVSVRLRHSPLGRAGSLAVSG